MSEAKIVSRGVDTLFLNVCYADKQFQPIKQELAEDLQCELNLFQNAARLNEAPVVTRWVFKGINSLCKKKVRLSSECLWSCEYLAEAIVEVGLFLYDMFGDYLWFQVSEVDLCADVVGWDVSQANWQDCFISRAVGDDGRPREDALLSFFTNWPV